jgi:hypothetical protein
LADSTVGFRSSVMNNKLSVTARTPKMTERGSEKLWRAASTSPSALIAGK